MTPYDFTFYPQLIHFDNAMSGHTSMCIGYKAIYLK